MRMLHLRYLIHPPFLALHYETPDTFVIDCVLSGSKSIRHTGLVLSWLCLDRFDDLDWVTCRTHPHCWAATIHAAHRAKAAGISLVFAHAGMGVV